MTNILMIEDPIEAFLANTKGEDVPITPKDFKEMREFFVDKELFDLHQKTLTDTLDRVNSTLEQICLREEDKERRIQTVEDGHKHEAECHELSAKRVKRICAVTGVCILAGTFLVSLAAFAIATR